MSFHLRHLRRRDRFGCGRLGQRGVAAVEFAICAPVLLLLFLGTLEILLLYRTEAKLNALAGNFAEMVSNQEIAAVSASGVTAAHSPLPSVTSGSALPGISDLCAGAVDGLQPFPASGLTIAIASVTQTVTKPASYDEWEVDMNSNCSPTQTQSIGVNGAAGARTLAVGNGGSTAMVQVAGDNIIIVRATLQYPGLFGLILTSAQTLTQTATARWRYASASNVTNTSPTSPTPASTLEFSCSGIGCEVNNGV